MVRDGTKTVTNINSENIFGSAYNVLFRRQTGPGWAETVSLVASTMEIVATTVSIAQNESLLAVKRIGKIIAVLQSSLVTLLRSVRFLKLITIGGGAGAPTFVQGNNHQNGGASSSTCAVTLTNPVASGNMLCVSLGSTDDGSNISTSTVTDDKGNSYTASDYVTVGAQNYSWLTFYILNVTNAPQTITATIKVSGTPTARAFASILVDEFSGIATSAAIDGHTVAAQVNIVAGTGVSSGNCTTTLNGDLVYGTSVDVTGAGTITKGASFTQAGINVANAFNTEYLIQSAASASTSATYTHSATDSFLTAVMCFKAAAQASQSVTLTRLRAGLKALTLSSAELVTLTRARGKSITISTAQLVTLLRSNRHLIAFTTALNVFGSAMASLTLRATGTGIAQVITLNRLSSISKTIAVAIAD